MIHLAGDGARALGSNLCKFCTGCRRVEFALLERIADVLGHDRALPPKQIGHLLLGQPDSIAVQLYLHAHATVGCLVEEDFAAGCLRHHWVLPVSLAAAMRRRSLQASGNNDSRSRWAMTTCPEASLLAAGPPEAISVPFRICQPTASSQASAAGSTMDSVKDPGLTTSPTST